MSKANWSALQQRLDQPRFPAAPGTSSLGPGNALRSAQDAQQFFCVRIDLLTGDPNSNGGLDSNGYYVAYIEGPSFTQSMGSVSPEVRVVPDNFVVGFSPPASACFVQGQRLQGYAIGQTSGSPDSADDNFMTLVPIGRPCINYFSANLGASGHGPTSGSGPIVFDTAFFKNGAWQESVVAYGDTTRGGFTINSAGTQITVPDNSIYAVYLSATLEPTSPSFDKPTAPQFEIVVNGAAIAIGSGSCCTSKANNSIVNSVSLFGIFGGQRGNVLEATYAGPISAELVVTGAYFGAFQIG